MGQPAIIWRDADQGRSRKLPAVRINGAVLRQRRSRERPVAETPAKEDIPPSPVAIEVVRRNQWAV